jgi:hypothetical protein
MRVITAFILLQFVLVGCSDKSSNTNDDDFTLVKYNAIDVSKTNSMKIYMHYMPWFESLEVNGHWGIHWTMANRNPNNIDNTGEREIASHFYPLIGPYSSIDKDVIEYHLLLMKLSGVDGILIDWYGSYDVYDYRQNLINSEALISKLGETGIQFGIVYEDYTAEKVVLQNKADSAIKAAKTDLRYMQDHYFSNDQYIKLGQIPLLLTFGPRYFQNESDWTQIFSELTTKPKFLTLMYASGKAGSNASGEFAWVNKNNLDDLDMFYNSRVPQLQNSMAAAYPGFYDYYAEGGWTSQDITWQIRYDGTSTLSATLNKAAASGLHMLQLITWNDFGEGTMFEPTLEFGYSFLETIQKFTGVTYDKPDLELVLRIYQYRKKYKDDSLSQLKLDQVFYYVVSLQMQKAKELLNTIE